MVAALWDRLVAFDGFGHLAPHRLRVRPGAARTSYGEVAGRRMLPRAFGSVMLLHLRSRGYVGRVQESHPRVLDGVGFRQGRYFHAGIDAFCSVSVLCTSQLCAMLRCSGPFSFVHRHSQDRDQDDEDLKWSQRRVPHDEVEYRVAACLACHRGRGGMGAGGAVRKPAIR